MSRIKDILQKIKQTCKESALPCLIFFAIGKIMFSFLELPHHAKSSTYIPFLLISFLFFAAAIGFKFYTHKFTLLRRLFKIQLGSFLVWVITNVYVIFTWSLCDALSWNLFEKILLVLC